MLGTVSLTCWHSPLHSIEWFLLVHMINLSEPSPVLRLPGDHILRGGGLGRPHILPGHTTNYKRRIYKDMRQGQDEPNSDPMDYNY